MYEVTVNRVELIDRMKKNRDSHREVFEKALEEYKTAVILELEEWLEKARKGDTVQRHTVLQQPQDHTKDYDRVLDMLEMSVNENITLDATSFAQYVRDEWSWRDQFGASVNSTRAYIASKA